MRFIKEIIRNGEWHNFKSLHLTHDVLEPIVSLLTLNEMVNI